MDSKLKCPACNNRDLTLKREAKFIYSYLLDENAPGLSNDDRFYSFQYDRRERTEAHSYIECNQCGHQIDCKVYPDHDQIRIECLNDET